MGRAEDNKRDKRERILRAGRDLFRRHGYSATTMDDIAGRAGVSKGALYFHVGSKAGLLNQVFGQDFTSWIDQAFADADARQHHGLTERLVDIYATLLELMCAQPELTRVYMADAGGGDGSDHATSAMNHLLALSSDLLDGAKQSGELSPRIDSRQLAYNLWALYFVEQHRWLLDHPDGSRDRSQIERRLTRPFTVQLAGHLSNG